MQVSELYSRCQELAVATPSSAATRYLHETLVLTCGEALTGSGMAFGNLFSQVDWLCKHHHMAVADRIAVQQMRRDSNSHDVLTDEQWRYDVRALVHFIAAVFQTDVPHDLLTLLPANPQPALHHQAVNQRYIRCIVTECDDKYIYATTDDGAIVCERTPFTPDASLLTPGTQLNLLDCVREGTTVQPGLIVLEPDFLVDISAIAACFQDYGHHPVSYLLNRLKPRANTQQILLGNFAGAALDDLIHQPTHQLNDTLRDNFREQALQFCTCEGFDAPRFVTDARQQTEHIREAVNMLFGDYDRHRALLEPSFICERLGLQGRVDLMTDDLRLLVEQKSGKNWNIERPQAGQKGQQKEDHYVQLLLYYGVLRYNFHLSADQVDIRLLYSKYPAAQGLLIVNFYQQLFREAIAVRNRIVAQELHIAREGFATILPTLQADVLLENPQRGDFFQRFIRPAVEGILQPLYQLDADERAYVERMMTFVYREQQARKMGVREGLGGAAADLWNMPLTEKIETGALLLGTLLDKDSNSVTLHTDYTTCANFRRGDMVLLYRYEQEPDVCRHLLYKGIIVQLNDSEVTIRLNNAQHNPQAFTEGTYAVEHATSDIGTSSDIRSLYAFCQASAQKKALLLGRQEPRHDSTLTLSRSYHPHYDEVLLKALQARDYFLLQGPPGTGKTSMALRFLVQEELASYASRQPQQPASLLLTAYTHRAVDEICGMLEDAAIDYLRIGHEASCDPRYHHRLLESAMGEQPKMEQLRERINATQVIVSTTATLQARPFIFQLKTFSLCIVDEASQILEPSIIGMLSSEHIKRFILIGDHKQLPAVIAQPDDKPELHSCRQSLFERLLRQEREAGRNTFIGLLRRQGRMHPDIAAFPNEMFYCQEQLQPVPCPHQTATTLDYQVPAEDETDRLLQQHRVLFLPSEPCRSLATGDKVNSSEARIVADLLRRIWRLCGADRFQPERTVGVIVPYRNQIAMIRREIERLDIPALLDISIDTVERYQGSQRDVIIYSFTVQQPYQLDFLTQHCFQEGAHTIDRKLNVAMTRARKQLLMTGNVQTLRQNAVFAELIRRYSK